MGRWFELFRALTKNGGIDGLSRHHDTYDTYDTWNTYGVP